VVGATQLPRRTGTTPGLSEGFATYFAAMAQEQYQGRDAFLATMGLQAALTSCKARRKADIPA